MDFPPFWGHISAKIQSSQTIDLTPHCIDTICGYMSISTKCDRSLPGLVRGDSGIALMLAGGTIVLQLDE